MTYTTPQKAKSPTLTMDRFQAPPTTKATHEGVEVVELFQKYIDIPQKGKFGFSFHLGKIKQCGIKVYHAKRIISIMLGRKVWVKSSSGEEMHCGKWLTNRYKEIKELGPEKFISKNS